MRGALGRPVCVRLAAALAMVVALQGAARAQDDFPGGKPIELTVLFPAGSSPGVTARVLADGMSKQLNPNVLVVNRPGAASAIGYKSLAAQSAGGHHLVGNSNAISTTFRAGTLPP